MGIAVCVCGHHSTAHKKKGDRPCMICRCESWEKINDLCYKNTSWARPKAVGRITRASDVGKIRKMYRWV